MKRIEKQLWNKYYELQRQYEDAVNNPLYSKRELEQMRDNIDMALEDLEDEDVDITKELI